MLSRRIRHALVVPLLVLSVVGLSACSTSGDAAGGLSLADKAKTAKVCVDVASAVKSASDVGAKVAQGVITQAEAAAQLEPIATQMRSLAEQNAALPIGTNLKSLSDSVVALQKVSSDAPTDFQTAAESLVSQTKIVVADCADLGQ